MPVERPLIEKAAALLRQADASRSPIPPVRELLGTSTDIDAELVHLVLAIGLKRLETEAVEASYAAEAAAYTEQDRALTAARRRRLAAIADRGSA